MNDSSNPGSERVGRARDLLHEHFRDLLMMFAVLLLAGDGTLLVVVANRQTAIQERQAAMQAEQVVMQKAYTEAVVTLAQWQGPTSMVTHTTFDSRPTTLGLQEARGECDWENLIERTRDGLRRVAAKE